MWVQSSKFKVQGTIPVGAGFARPMMITVGAIPCGCPMNNLLTKENKTGWKEVYFLTEALFPSPTPLKKKGGSRREDKHLIWNGQNYVLRLLNCSRNGLNKKLQIEKYFKIIK